MADDLHTKQSQPWYAMSLKKKVTSIFDLADTHEAALLDWKEEEVADTCYLCIIWNGDRERQMPPLFEFLWLESPETCCQQELSAYINMNVFWLELKWRLEQVRIPGEWVTKARKSMKFNVLNTVFPLIYFLSAIPVVVFCFSDCYF